MSRLQPRVTTWWAQRTLRRVFAAEPALRARLTRVVPDPDVCDGVVLGMLASVLETLASALRAALRAARPSDDDLQRLSRLAATWPATQRQVFTLRKVYGMRPPDIARRLGLTDAAVDRHLIAAALAVCDRQLAEPDAPAQRAGAYGWHPPIRS
jgi:DNA-directed RNA polymerase specialized sigma24 family protein